MTCDINPHILRWLNMVDGGEIKTCNDQKLLTQLIRKSFAEENIYTDAQQLEQYLGLAKYFPFEKVFEWEEFCLALHLTTFWLDSGKPRWPHLFILIARGAGKDGFIALEGLSLASPYSKLLKYDVDICANAEEQAMRPVEDIVGVLEDSRYNAKMKKYFKWTKEKVVGLDNQSVIRGRTNNPKSKDGMRSGIVVFNELHQYANYNNIKVFITGLGKKKHPRRLDATTNGDVREGPLDDLIAKAEQILKGAIPDNGMLPFICRLDSKEEVDDKTNWVKANPSLIHLPDLMDTIDTEYREWKLNPIANADFMTKRMNLPQSDTEIAVTEWENIEKTNKPLPDLLGRECVVGIDFARITDFMSAVLHFREGDLRYDIHHSWLCLRSRDLHRINAPWREWATYGNLTLIDDVEIHPEIICEWILQQGQKYNIRKIAMDNYRYALLKRALMSIGFDAKDNKNICLVRPSDIMKVQPVIESAFANQYFSWGDEPVLRWATNNTKLVRASKSQGSDTGSFYYAKIEAKSRKTDPFMALVAAMVIEDELLVEEAKFEDIPVIIG